MNNKFALSAAILGSILLSACATTPTSSTVIQKENNQFEVTGLGKTSIISKNNAVAAANKTCKNSTPIVVSEKTEYNGSLKGVVDDQTGQMIQAAADVIGSIAGTNTSISKDTDYQTVVTFYCKAN
jgi:uncharacterized protein (DUF2252 family)